MNYVVYIFIYFLRNDLQFQHRQITDLCEQLDENMDFQKSVIPVAL